MIPALPPRLSIEVTNRCGLHCASCARLAWDPAKNPIGDIDERILQRLEPFFAAAMEVTIGGYGDPTEHADLAAIVARIKRNGPSVRLITGGAKLTVRLIAQLVDAGLDRLVLSMDGATDATLRALRGVPLAAYRKWLRALAKARGESFSPLAQLNVVAQRRNVAELPALIDFAADEGVAGVHAFHIKVYRDELDGASLLAEPDSARPHFEAARERANRRGVFLHLPTLDPAPIPCRQPFETLFVRHDGQVRGCCSAMFEPADHGLAVGHLLDEVDPASLFAAPILQQFRDATTSGRDDHLPEPCQTCAFRLPTRAAHRRILPRLPVLAHAS